MIFRKFFSVARKAEAIQRFTIEVSRHRQTRRVRSERVGTVPFGYRVAADGVQLEADGQEQAISARIREPKAAGQTLRQIAAELNARGYTTGRGPAWRHQYVAAALAA